MTTRIGFSTPKKFNPVSWLVRKISKSAVSHCFFIYHDKDWDINMVMEAHELGFRLIPFAHFEKKNKIIAIIKPKVSLEEGLQHVALEYLGTSYDFIGGFMLLMWRWFGRKWRNPLVNVHSIVCSEAAVIAMRKGKYPNSESLVPQDIMPQDLLEFFMGKV